MVSYIDTIKKTKAYKIILKDKEASKLNHTYLLLSEDMAYAKEFAKTLAKIMLDIKPSTSGELKIDKDIHPDVIISGLEKKFVSEDATNIVSDVYVRPFEEDKKVYIILNAQDMNDESQNKLLKTFEEPPASVFFILASNSEKKLLQTVLSRSKKIELDLLDKETIEKMLEEADVSVKERKIAAACSNGIFSRALKMTCDKEFLNMYDNIFECLFKMNSSRDVLDFSYKFLQKEINKEEFVNLFMIIVRDICFVKSGNDQLVCNNHKISELKLISEQFSLTALYKILEYCLQLQEDLVYNTNITMAIDEFLLKVVEVKVRCKK